MNMQKSSSKAIALVAAISAASALACHQTASAAVTFFSDEAAFAAAAGSLETEDFEGFASDASFASSPLDLGAFTLSAAGGLSALVDTPPFEFPSSAPPTGNFVQRTGSNYTTTFTFDTPISAFGLDASDIGVGNATFVRTRLDVGGEIYVPDQDGLSTQFIGFLSDTPVTEIVFRTVLNDGWQFDNVRYAAGTLPPGDIVPIPAAALLFAPVVAGLAFPWRKVGANTA
jgi:hypothetical protein